MTKRAVQALRGALSGVMTAVLVLTAVASASAQPGAYTYTKINVPGSVYTEATGVNNSGHVVGTYQDTTGRTHGFVYNGTTYTTIDFPNSNYNYVFGVNAAGQMVGGYSVSNPLGVYHGFLYHNGVFTEFDYPQRETDGRGINNLGQIVGIYNQGFGTPDHGFLKDGENYTSLDYPGAAKTYTFGINDHGVITGTWVDALNRLRGYWYHGGLYTALNFPGASQTYIGGVNNSHTIAGWSMQGTTLKTSFVLTTLASFRSFSVPFAGATATQARAINDNGQVVGTYTSPDCPRFCGFIATPNPTAMPTCTQSVALNYANNALTMNFTVGTSSAMTWTTYVFINGVPYPLWSAPLPAIHPAVPASYTLPLAPVGRVIALSTLGTATGGILCADYAVINTSPGGTP